MSLRSTSIRVTAKGFDIQRKISGSPTDSIVLLKRDGTTNPYAVLKTYTKGFKVGFSNYRNQSEIEIATEDDLSADVTRLMGIALMSGLTGKICMISNGDIVPPGDDQFTWRFFGSIKVGENYIVEA